jgi:hypothetical protein
VALIVGRISDIEATITLLEEKLEPFNVAPRELSYHRQNQLSVSFVVLQPIQVKL